MSLPSDIRTITMIGAGNVAWHLARGLYLKGYSIREIWSRTEQSATELATRVRSHYTSTIQALSQETDMFIIAVNDATIPAVVRTLDAGTRLVVHTAGSVNMLNLAGVSPNFGVLYPLQTLSKHIPVNLAEVPFCIEASSGSALELLRKVAGDLSVVVRDTASKERLLLHVAAVFASNYSNLMYTLASDILSSKGLSFDLLKPLVAETAHKVLTSEPARVQTGPAKRGDQEVLDKHLKLLASMPEYAEIYQMLADRIKERFQQ